MLAVVPNWLLKIAGVPADEAVVRDARFAFEGLDTGAALLIATAFAAGAAWLYLRGPGELSRTKRVALAALRTAFIAGVLLVLTRPVLQLTRDEPTRATLLALVDTSASMDLADPRANPADLARAAIATGDLPPGPVDRPVPAGRADDLAAQTRRQLLEAASANPQLDLWSNLLADTDLLLVPFDREAGPARPADASNVNQRLADLPRGGPASALGDSLVGALDAAAGQPLAGILLFTDGATNAGRPATAAIEAAQRRQLPIFAIASGVTAPRDLAIVSFNGPAVAFARELAPLQVRLRADDLAGRSTELVLLQGEREILRRDVAFDRDGETELTLDYTPDEAGEITLTAEVAALEGETTAANNRADAALRVIDRRIRVLVIEQEPRWEFRYLLDTLDRDRRVEVRAHMLDSGDPELGREPDSAFLPELPDARGLLENVIVVLGDIDPARLGDERMRALVSLVRDTGGGLAFLAGPRHGGINAFRGTPLEPLLPVEPAAGPVAPAHPDPAGLLLTSAGRASPILRIAPNPVDNASLWQTFPGVRWTARTGPARPAAQVLLVDPAKKTTAGQPQPVLAIMPSGRGQVFYFGFGETWLWRSRVGEQHYLRIWGQVFLKLGVERLSGASDLVQLNTARPAYTLGDKIVVSGRIFEPDFRPLEAPQVKATLRIEPAGDDNPPAITREVVLNARPGRPGDFETELIARTVGRYTLVTDRDPEASVTFTVDVNDLELANPALHLDLLRQLAEATGGEVFREEDLARLPDLVARQRPTATVVRRVELAFNAWLLGALFLIASAEWLVRRLNRLK
ncbi:MAG: hypothetical protein ABII82_07200 [Verrucomicrobiota bacterium]